ncbi:MAG: ABC transporter substrate-binding protein [Thiohalomonadales bacterium]
MIDRQWLKISEMQVTLQEQAKDLRSLSSKFRNNTQDFQVGVPRNGSNIPDKNLIPAAFKNAYQATQQPDYAEGDWFVRAFGNVKTITPYVSQDTYASIVQKNVLESLLVRNGETLKWQGLLAESWQESEDGLTFTFKIRPEARFSDGTELTADDVVFTYNFVMNEKIAAPQYRVSFVKIKSVTATNKHEVVFVYKEPYYNALFDTGWEMKILPKHFYEKYLKDPHSFNQSKGLLLGSGPYRLKDPVSWTPDKGFIELERNPRYWGFVQPPFDKLIWKFIENASARLTTFRNGDIDNYRARPVEYKKLLSDKEILSKSDNWEYMSPVAGYSYIGWNQQRNNNPTRFADKRVRQAMTYLTDRKGFIKDIMLGYAEPAISPFNPRTKQHAPELLPREYDLEKARLLLKSAGYEDRDGDGIIEDINNKAFEFEIIYSQDSEDTKRIVLYLKDSYARAGILLKPNPTEWTVLLDKLNTRTFDGIILGWSSGLETDVSQMFHSNQIKDGDNYTHYSNKELDRLIGEARRTVDEKRRMKIWQKVEHILYEDQPYTFLMRSKSLQFIDKRIKNLAIDKLGLNYRRIPYETYVPVKAQRYAPK